MTEKQFKALTELHEKQLAATENLASLLKTQGGKNGNGDEQEQTQEPDKEKPDETSAKILGFMSTVTDKLEKIDKKLDKATTGQPGTKIPTNTGASKEASFL